MAKPDRELEELDQRFSEVERTIQSACEIMGKLREASPLHDEAISYRHMTSTHRSSCRDNAAVEQAQDYYSKM